MHADSAYGSLHCVNVDSVTDIYTVEDTGAESTLTLDHHETLRSATFHAVTYKLR
jgi:hypothetical protein